MKIKGIRRKIENELVSWFHANDREAILIDGARQVGKTYIVREFGREHFSNVVELNFVKDKSLKKIFENVANESDIFTRISALPGVKLLPGKTLIFFDEVQECQEIVTYIKFLVDDGRYRYVLSGSLLGIELNNLRSTPVGYLRELKMYPLDFEEFIRALGLSDEVISHLKTCWSEKRIVDPVIHDRVKTLFKLYLVVGGMPAVVKKYLETENIAEVVKEQKSIIVEYRRDATKYAEKLKLKVLEAFDLIPEELNRKNKRFHVSDLSSGSRYAREEDNFIWLKSAGIGLQCTAVNDPRVPLRLSQNSGFFKLYMNDVGLLSALFMEGVQFKILSGETSINHGAIYENFIAQELTAHGFAIHYFMGEDIGEIDFMLQYDGKILPVEAKSGKHYRTHAALDNLMKNNGYGIDHAAVFSDYNVISNGSIDYFPVYMIMFYEHDKLPENAVYRKPSVEELKVNPRFV